MKEAQLKRIGLVNLRALTWYVLFLLVRDIVERKLLSNIVKVCTENRLNGKESVIYQLMQLKLCRRQ